jgi:two-component system alkaline phosphatase synthesis response regulator PhoP
MSPRILVVDDDREIMRLVRIYLEQSGYEVLVAYDGETALSILRHEHPDLMLLDLMLSGCDAPGVTRVNQGDTCLAAMPTVMLTARAADPGKIVGLELGANDFAAKPFNPWEVVAGVRAVLHRMQGKSSPAKEIQVRGLRVSLDARRVEVGGRLVHLTPTEFGLLRALAEQPGHALTRQEMIERGLGYSYEGSERTVDSHVKNLRRKLDAAGKVADLVETVFGIGYRFVASAPERLGDEQ